MLKRIDPSEVELGMFIHKLEGSWFKHPFWRSRFLLTDEERLDRLRQSDVDGVIIDTERGCDLEPAPAADPQSPSRQASIPSRTRLPGARRASLVTPQGAAGTSTCDGETRSLAPRTLAREFGQARAIADRGKKAVSRVFLEARLGKTVKPGVVEPVVNDIYASVQRNPHAFNGLMRCRRDSEPVYRHALATSALMITLGRAMKLSPEELQFAGMAGLLHDIGIAHVPELNGDHDRLSSELRDQHVHLAHQQLLASGMASEVAVAALQHHERIDGQGYPARIGGDAIGVLGRMLAICDAYDGLANGNEGGLALDPAAAVQQMCSDPGAFDPDLLDRFIEAMGAYPIGAIVLLRSGRLGMVIDQNPTDPALPTVRVFHSLASGLRISPSDIDLANCYGEDAIEGIATPEEQGIGDMPRLRERLFCQGMG